MTTARTFTESMFVLVAQGADGEWYPVVPKGCLALFTSGESAKAFLARVRGLPAGTKISRESGWERVVGVMRLARDGGATLVAVDPAATVKAVPLDASMKALETMLEQVALTATAALRGLLIKCAARMGSPEPNLSLAEGVEVLGRVVGALAPQGDIAEAAESIGVFLRSLAAKEAGIEPAPRFVFAPEGAIGVFARWVEARMDLLHPKRGQRQDPRSN
jgi:hypothetical protein